MKEEDRPKPKAKASSDSEADADAKAKAKTSDADSEADSEADADADADAKAKTSDADPEAEAEADADADAKAKTSDADSEADSEADAKAKTSDSDSEADSDSDPKSKAPKAKKPRKTSRDDPTTWGVPRFAADFPDDPRLTKLVRAFADGNYAKVKSDGDVLASDNAASDDVRDAARLLVARTRPDPTSKLLFLFAGGLLVFLTAWWLTHDRPADARRGSEPPPKVEIIR